MNVIRRYTLLAYSLLKKHVRRVLPHFKHLKPVLESAYFTIPIEEYLAAMILTAALAFPGAFLLGVVIGIALGYQWLGVLIVSILFAILVDGLIIGVFMMYPQYKLKSISNNIEKFLPYAATHMATIAGTGVPPQVIFQMIGGFKDYGMVSYICERIARNVTVFGYDIVTAISEEAKRVPSYKFKDILWSIASTIRSGGDLRGVLLEKSKALMEDQRRTEAKYIEFLSMMAEVYATVFVAGTIIIFVMVSIIGVIGGLPIPVKSILQLFTYLMIPLASIAFIVMIDSTKPTGV